MRLTPPARLSAVLSALVFWNAAHAGGEPLSKESIRILKTEQGVRFGIIGDPPNSPAPTLFILAGEIEETLVDPSKRQCGGDLADLGYLCVAVDIPCFGKERREGEPHGIVGWAGRCAKGENFVAESNSRLSGVLDRLIRVGYTDEEKVAACGTSRGGFLALHFAAADPRVKCVAAFAPVTDPRVLVEFESLATDPLVESLSVANHAGRLAGRSIWISIGDRDERVGTDEAVATARGVTSASLGKGLSADVELHVVPEPEGHVTPRGAAEWAARWIEDRLGRP